MEKHTCKILLIALWSFVCVVVVLGSSQIWMWTCFHVRILFFTLVTETPEPVQTGGVYRPPGAREGGRPRRAQQGPPEIYSDTQFPSLQSTAKLVDSRK